MLHRMMRIVCLCTLLLLKKSSSFVSQSGHRISQTNGNYPSFISRADVRSDFSHRGLFQTNSDLSFVEALSSNSLAVSSGHESDIVVFVVGLIPFAWASVEFWRRIAVGATFGTGEDSVTIIGEDGAPGRSRGRRVLGRGALVVAYILFGIAIGVLVLCTSAVFNDPFPVENVQLNQ